MNSVEYEELIEKYNWQDLEMLWADIQSFNTPKWDDGKALEYLISRAFKLEGAKVKYPYSVTFGNSKEDIEQIDGLVIVNSIYCLIECKDYSENDKDGNRRKRTINIDPIAKLRNQILRRPSSTIGAVFSSGGFTEVAVLLSRFIYPQTVLLWTGSDIEYCLKNKTFSKGLIDKYSQAISNSTPDYDLKSEGEI